MVRLLKALWTWGRLMTNRPNRAQGAALRQIVKLTATELGVRNSALMVLNTLLDCMTYNTEQARCSRAKLMIKIGRTEKTVKVALKELRDVGIIYPVAYPQGGAGRCPVYMFRVTPNAVRFYNSNKTGEKIYPLTKCALIEKGGKNFQKEGKKIPERGVKITPPSKVSSLNKGNEERASRPHGLSTDGLRLCPATNQPKTFTEFCKGVTYVEARTLWDGAEICAETDKTPSPVE